VVLIAQIVDAVFQLASFLVIVNVVISYFMSPFHPLRQSLDSVIEPLLRPIRRIMPATGMVDFSPMVLILILFVARRLLVGLLLSF
jgi:YggT family protein